MYVQFPLLQQLSEARERTWVVQRAVVRHPAQHGHVGGQSAHKTAQSPPLECQDGRTWPHTPGALYVRLGTPGGAIGLFCGLSVFPRARAGRGASPPPAARPTCAPGPPTAAEAVGTGRTRPQGVRSRAEIRHRTRWCYPFRSYSTWFGRILRLAVVPN